MSELSSGLFGVSFVATDRTSDASGSLSNAGGNSSDGREISDRNFRIRTENLERVLSELIYEKAILLKMITKNGGEKTGAYARGYGHSSDKNIFLSYYAEQYMQQVAFIAANKDSEEVISVSNHFDRDTSNYAGDALSFIYSASDAETFKKRFLELPNPLEYENRFTNFLLEMQKRAKSLTGEEKGFSSLGVSFDTIRVHELKKIIEYVIK